jgi:uncharacterized repeat protein (TIGR03803 family)
MNRKSLPVAGTAPSQSQKNPTLRMAFILILAMAGSAFGQTLTTIYSFGSAKHDGLAPGSGVIIDKDGNLFGTTGVGGKFGAFGTVFELTPPAVQGDQYVETILHRFQGSPDGKIPLSRLAFANDGGLVGTTIQGGVNGLGTAYEVASTPKGVFRDTILHSFGSTPDDVISPDLGLLVEPEGLYGVDQGGTSGWGAVYLLTPPTHGKSWTQHILYNFLGNGDAASPGGELVRDAAGNFYGVTAQGGINNLGAIYEISPPAISGDPWTEKVLYSFNGSDGTLPTGPLLMGPGGVFYGTTNGGGPNSAGTVYQLTPPLSPGDSWTLTTIYAFTGGVDGTSPSTGVIAGKRGVLYGTAGGAIFMLQPPIKPATQWTETVLHAFSFQDGFIASSPLTLFKNILYGTTAQGGTFRSGTVFQLTLP